MTALRRARDGDLAAVAALDATLFPDDPWRADAWQELVATAGRRLLVAVEPGDDLASDARPHEVPDQVVGYALTGLVGDFAELLRIGVDPAHRRRGIAAALLQRASEAARADGAERLLLEVSDANTGAGAFYDSRGFVEIDRRPGYYRDGSAARVLERALPVPERMDP